MSLWVDGSQSLIAGGATKNNRKGLETADVSMYGKPHKFYQEKDERIGANTDRKLGLKDLNNDVTDNRRFVS